jgi:hypothetical protein
VSQSGYVHHLLGLVELVTKASNSSPSFTSNARVLGHSDGVRHHVHTRIDVQNLSTIRDGIKSSLECLGVVCNSVTWMLSAFIF